MKLRLTPKSGWLWLSLLCGTLLITLISIEFGLVYPQVKRYFDNTDSLTSQQLVARSRGYLIKSLQLLSEAPGNDADYSLIRHNLDLTYGLLNVNLYLKQYPCTASALKQIDALDRQLQNASPLDLESYIFTIIPVLQCTDVIQTGQDNKRSTLAIEMAENLDFHRKILLWGTLFIITTGIGFWALHMKQRRLIAHNKDETQKWIRHAMQDGLTGVLNRRAFDTDLKRYIERYMKNRNLFALLMCDIDYFKQYNDTLGHIEGDKALQSITQALSKVLRNRDSLYRYGGEELIIILDNADKSQAKSVGLRALEQVRELRLTSPKNQHGHLTISIGCATISEATHSKDTLLELVDKRLYKAKQNGRNCLVHS